ncbi:MAG: peptidoglycan-binding protein [Christensenellaceae bacterium]|jgi:hypothetical protein|nr:peptidoglycan-binding protein [Christensenellaceae bacterium]
MASTLKLGSRGDEVKQLQTLLNSKGANLTVDGIFGNNTLSAVRNYQGGNSLSVDGIVGNNTWSSLLGNAATGSASGSSSYSSQTTPYGAASTAPRPTYTPSAQVNQAFGNYQAAQANKPGPYSSAWQAQLDDLLGKIQGRKPFSYDFNVDPIYKQYKDQYTRQGNLAMQDTMANAATLSGGYGNSYASVAGNLAYQNSLQQLNNVIPELAGQAYGRYQDEGQQLYNQFGLINGMEDRDYSRYRDTVGDYYSEADRLRALYNDLWNQDRSVFGDSLSGWEYDQDRAYQMSRDAVGDAQWEKEYALAQQQASKSGGSGSSSSKSTGPDWNVYEQTVWANLEDALEKGNLASAQNILAQARKVSDNRPIGSTQPKLSPEFIAQALQFMNRA